MSRVTTVIGGMTAPKLHSGATKLLKTATTLIDNVYQFLCRLTSTSVVQKTCLTALFPNRKHTTRGRQGQHWLLSKSTQKTMI